MAVARVYSFENVLYTICETSEIHELLQGFVQNYLSENSANIEATIPLGQENINSCANFAWTAETTRLLISEYGKRLNEFRAPRVKKIKLWREIQEVFSTLGHNVNEAALDRKIRNMKHHYKTIVDNNKKSKTGRGRISWEYFNTFEQLFAEDKTIHPGNILSSFNFQTVSQTLSRASELRLSTSQQTILSPLPLGQSNPQQNILSPSVLGQSNTHQNILSPSELGQSTSQQNILSPSALGQSNTQQNIISPSALGQSTSQHNILSPSALGQFTSQPSAQSPLHLNIHIPDSDLSPRVKCPGTPSHELCDEDMYAESPQSHRKKPITKKAIDMRQLYGFRKHFLEVKERRVAAIEKLSGKLSEYNEIQRERNDILKKNYKIE